MKRILLLGLAAGVMSGAQYRSVSLTPGSSMNLTLPGAAPYQGMQALRAEFRLHNWTASGNLVVIGDIYVGVLPDPLRVRMIDCFDSCQTGFVEVPPTTTDLLFRVQRNTYTRTASLEVWTPGGQFLGSGLVAAAAAPVNVSGVRMFDEAPGTLAWFNLYDTVVPLDGDAPGNTPTGNLLAYDFEGNTLDSSGQGRHLTVTGTESFTTTPLVPLLRERRVVRAGYPFQLDCGGTDAASYFWQQLSGPLTASIQSRESALTTITGVDVFGEYRFQCTAGDAAGQSVPGVITVGAVATNDAGVVVPPSTRIGFLLGPMLRGGASPWPYYDQNRPRRSSVVGQSIVAAAQSEINNPLAGTVSLVNGSSSVTGTGTLFNTQYAANSRIVLFYDHGGGVIGRAIRIVASVTDNTHLTLSAPWDHGAQSGAQHQRWGTGNGSDANILWDEHRNYYDLVLSLYVSYYKTGFTEFAGLADQMAQLWWLYADLGQVYNFAPRSVSLEGLMIAAERGVLDAAEVYRYADDFNWLLPGGSNGPGYRNYITIHTSGSGQQNLWFGAREGGYVWRFATALAVLHPDADKRAAWTSRLAVNIGDYWRDFQCKASNPVAPGRCRTPQGSFRWEEPAWAPDLAEQSWHTGIAMQGFIRYHRLTGNATAAVVMTDWLNNQLTGVQPGGVLGSTSLYHGSVLRNAALDVACRSHYYWQLRGSESVLTVGDGSRFATDPYLASDCDYPTGVYVGRDTNNELVSSYGYGTRLGLASKARGEDTFGATYGADDGFTGQWAWPPASKPAKSFAQALCCNDSYLVDRLPADRADTTSIPAVFVVSFYLPSVPNAVKVRFSVLAPDSTTLSTVCTASPCTVTGERRLGEHQLRLEYLSASDAVLASSEWSVLNAGLY